MKTLFNKKPNGKTILVVAECQEGALKAGRFALKHLYEKQTRVVLLQTYKAPKFGLSGIRDLTSILKKISKEDLTTLKNTLIQEFCIPADNILKLAIEGNLSTIAQQEFRHYDNLSIVIGTDCTPLYSKNPYNQIFSLMTTGIRPIYIVDDFISLIDRTKIIVISEKVEDLPERFKNFLFSISNKDKIPVEYLTEKNKTWAPISKENKHYFLNEVLE